MDHDNPEWERYRRIRKIATFSTFGILWGFLGTLAITETAEVFFGFPRR